MIQIVRNIQNIDFSEIIDIYLQNGWGKRYSKDKIKQLFESSNYVLFAQETESKKVIGFIRILTDGIMTSWIAEILIKPEYQAKGIGRRLLDESKTDLGCTDIYGETFIENEKFFAKCGFDHRPKMIVVSRKSEVTQ